MISEKKISWFLFIALLSSVSICYAQTDESPAKAVSKVWLADNGDGTYKNPILYADYSDPDVVRVGEDYYMVASSFNCVPGMPVLHSKDLVNWELINYALPKLEPASVFDQPQHGNGIWAPCIRYHKGEFFLYYPDPDYGIFLTKASDPTEKWSEPVLVKAGKGLIDPSPLWDDDGKAYLVHAFAASRAGVNNILLVHQMSADGTALLDGGVLVFDGHRGNPVVEGPKFYKRNGYYYIFAPAGGVARGWQMVLRSKNVFGPYEKKRVLEQGSTSINGPHQGAWVDTPSGEDWFIHFQERNPNGRVVLLEPMQWKNDWPVMGIDFDGNGIGEPVSTHKKPNVGKDYPLCTPPESDEFNSNTLGLQWQWHANPHQNLGFPAGSLGFYRLNCTPKPDGFTNLWTVPNLLLQKFPAGEFTATVKLTFDPRSDGEQTGLLVMGLNYQYITLKQENGKLGIQLVRCLKANDKTPEELVASEQISSSTIFLRVTVTKDALCYFSYSETGKDFKQLGEEFKPAHGLWIGAKMGLFALREGSKGKVGTVDVDWFRVTPVKNE